MHTRIKLGDIAVDVVRKEIKNVHLAVYPPSGRVRIAAPKRLSLDTIRVFAISKLAWIRRQQTKLLEQKRETPREYLSRESHYVWGKRYLLKIVEADQLCSVEVSHNRLVFRVRPRTDQKKRQSILEEWYREQVKAAASPLVERWGRRLGVTVRRIFVQRMKTKMGELQSSRSQNQTEYRPRKEAKGVSRIYCPSRDAPHA
jgi:predicted metal-dependent hydrolase